MQLLGLLTSLFEHNERDRCTYRLEGGRSTLSLRKGGRSPRQIVRSLGNSSDSGKPSCLARPGHRWPTVRARGIGFGRCTSNSCDPVASSPVACLVWMQSVGLQRGWGEVAEKSLRVAHHDQAASLSLPVAVSGYTRMKRITWAL